MKCKANPSVESEKRAKNDEGLTRCGIVIFFFVEGRVKLLGKYERIAGSGESLTST